MTCDVCGHEMRRKPVSAPPTDGAVPVRERWFCRWCYAWTELGHDPGEIARPQYEPMTRRWERARSPELPEDVGHAYDVAYAHEGVGATLCGIRDDSVSASPYPWVPSRPDTCPACRDVATVIDGRWPVEMRGSGKRIHPAPPTVSRWPPF
ncbi:hypothetical protein O7634_20650 [Micromonospora sp. WMMD1120]|uniref:hypothetical protein n=1 Tax=Micromonospora sp. WMMD1120 TaxID=3016106 RepID=UPI0024166C29|nr:hypothetical protein [Micromonospora sp. WMMD1120]MDG4809166.1 hypothetical protein [Micromonospora sp. WMMD1120]